MILNVSSILPTPIHQKLPYDKAALPVKQIDAFMIVATGGARQRKAAGGFFVRTRAEILKKQ